MAQVYSLTPPRYYDFGKPKRSYLGGGASLGGSFGSRCFHRSSKVSILLRKTGTWEVHGRLSVRKVPGRCRWRKVPGRCRWRRPLGGVDGARPLGGVDGARPPGGVDGIAYLSRMSFKEDIKKLIAQRKTDKALKQLSERARTDEDLDEMLVISLQSRLASTDRDEMLGIRTSDQLDRQRNQINYAILSILDDLDDSDHQPAAQVPAAVAERQPATSGGGAAAAPAEATPAAPRVAKRVFVSYAREDRKYVEELEKNMAVLRRQGYVSSWDDSKIKPGESWSADIEENLKAADIIIYLVSSDFLNSNYIYDNERPWAEELVRTKGAKIIPIIIRACDWTSDSLARLQVIPSNDLGRIVPVNEWESKDEAYTKVIRSLREII